MGNHAARRAIIGLAAAATGVIGGAVAYACIPIAQLELTPPSAPTGTVIGAQGRGFTPGLPLEVRLNSPTGIILWNGLPNDGDVNFSFTVPKASPGFYTVLGIQKGKTGDPARAALEITRSASTATQETANTQTNTQQEQQQTTQQQEQQQTTQQQSTQQQNTQERSTETASQQADQSSSSSQSEQAARQEASTSSPAEGRRTATDARAAAATPQQRAVAVPGVTPQAPIAPSSGDSKGIAAATAVDVEEATSQVSPRSATGDPWSGFAGESGDMRGPSLTDPSRTGGTPGLPTGVAMLAVGLVGLTTSAAAMARRRRALVQVEAGR